MARIGNTDRGWYIYRDSDSRAYLHQDGQWRVAATSGAGELTGYFTTKAGAEAALAKAMGQPVKPATPRLSILASLLAEMESNPA